MVYGLPKAPQVLLVLRIKHYSQTIEICHFIGESSTYDHRVWKTGLPVRSAVLKPHAGELVVGWVTTSESSLLYVFFVFLSVSDQLVTL
jgi:hypothetical protein